MPRVKIYVTLKPSLLDAQGKVVQNALAALGYDAVQQVRIGKYIELDMTRDGEDVGGAVREMCDRLLPNPVIEDYRYEVTEWDSASCAFRALCAIRTSSTSSRMSSASR